MLGFGRIFGFLLVVATFAMGASVSVFAKKATYANWLATPISKGDFTPYIGRQKLGQRSHKDDDIWTPQDWIENEGDETAIIRDFYEADIIVKQFVNSQNVPVLRVGESFVKLSNFDQKRVLDFVDFVFQITTAEENGMFYVQYERDDKEPLGLYNKHGFQSY